MYYLNEKTIPNILTKFLLTGFMPRTPRFVGNFILGRATRFATDDYFVLSGISMK